MLGAVISAALAVGLLVGGLNGLTADRGISTPAAMTGSSDGQSPAPAAAAAAGAITAQAISFVDRPSFRVPFECGETWTGSAWSGHKPYYAIDFNHYPQDYGWKVTASSGGTVKLQPWASGYGHYLIIEHGNGWSTQYAHLSSIMVKNNQRVSIGQVIGRVGNSGGHGAPMASHLHYEQRYNGNDTAVVFYGNQHVKYFSKIPYKVNCSGGSSPHPSYPYSIGKICGSSYRQIDSHAIAGGKIVLAYSSTTGKNCVATMKSGNFKTRTAMTTFVRTKAHRASDSGSFGYYAGPAKLAATGTCVQWGGSIGGRSWTSGYGHCG
jgi:hypothetical protein